MKGTIHLDLEFHPFNMDEIDHMKNLVIWMKWIPILYLSTYLSVERRKLGNKPLKAHIHLWTNSICGEFHSLTKLETGNLKPFNA
jgi:hypothetical protein